MTREALRTTILFGVITCISKTENLNWNDSQNYCTPQEHDMSVQLAKKLFTVDEYHNMIDACILTEDDRVELLGGEIVEMSPIGSRHAAIVNRLNHIFNQRLGNKTIVSIQNPIHLVYTPSRNRTWHC